MFIFGDESLLQDIKNERIKFLPFSQRNDPFENPLLAQWHQVHDDDLDMDDDQFHDFIRQQYDQLADSYRKLMTFDYFLEQALSNKERFIQQARQKQTATQKDELDISHFNRYQQVLTLSLYRQLGKPRIWDIYGNRYKGVAIEVAANDGYFTDKNYQQKPQFFTPVRYRDSRPDTSDKQHPFPYLVNKPSSYEVDEETKLMRPVQAAEKLIDEDYYFKFPAHLVKGIYFGPLMELATAEKHRDYFKIDQRYRRVSCYRMRTHPQMFQLDFDPL